MDCSKLVEDGTPELGMEFNSEEDAYKFYNKYAFKMGFSVRKDYLNKDKDGVTTSRRYSCCKEGVKRKYEGDVMPKRTRAPTKTGCGAKMVIVLFRGTMKYRVHDLVLEHNHELHIAQCAHMMPSQRKVSETQGFQAEISEDAGLSLKQSHELMEKEADGMENVGYTREDLKRYLRTRRERSLKYGEAGSMLNYFQEQTLENPSFFHAVQLDCEEQITNIFWADAGMLIDYKFFGDVVTFDTTYKTNKEYRPLGVFVGFNQHRQIVIFDAALMYDETIDSFKWVFGTFVEAMCGKHPSTILTDQDHAMAAALSVVMPEIFHGLCTFHIRRNFMKHLGNHYKENSDLPYMFGACMYEFEEVEQFNRVWEAMVKKHNLENNEWLSGLYKIRDKWARCMMKERWTAGMRSTQLSESLNAAIKNHLKLDHDLVQFFRHFNRVVDEKRHNELIAEYEMRQKLPMVGLRQTPMLVHASETYSPTVFVAFQNEYGESTAMVILRQQDAAMFVEFAVMRYDGGLERIVVFNRNDLSVHCSCKKYENQGILCGHALKVFDTVGIKIIPPEYIKRRWTKRARAGDCFDRRGQEVVADPKVMISTRYRELAPAMIKVATRAAMSEDTSKVAITVISDLSKRVELLLSESEEQPLQNQKNLNMEERDKIEIVNEMGEAVVARGIKKRGGGKKSRVMQSWVDKFDRVKRKSRLSRTTQTTVSESEPTSVSFEEYMFMGCRSSTDSVSTHSMSQTVNGPPNVVAPDIDESQTIHRLANQGPPASVPTEWMHPRFPIFSKHNSIRDVLMEERGAISTHCDVDAYHVFAPSPQGRNNTQGLQLRVDVASPQNEVDE
ncbi:protein FAR1-RELATED SEQUENCE 5-like [Coffea eugenioides]|uniref:protein FAR1-RELATED SEQUENCE 5-like n=1 Tax=Coffea eugenioides TaxID=49369 RepID=UPI000F607A59|nr:protein FAR1-RELATED SEQUENCE 5-like [Coffea eugenioides]